MGFAGLNPSLRIDKIDSSDLPVRRLVDGRVESSSQKYSCFHPPQIISITLAIPPHQRGVGHRHERGRDAVDAAAFCAQRDRRAGFLESVSDRQHADERRLRRTVKSCGPDAPTLASSLRVLCRPYRVRTKRQSASDGGKKARSPGRVRNKPLKPSRAGMPGDSGVLVVARVRSTTIIAHETAGAAGIRHSPRPYWGER
jgi:hypothetical protein